MFKHIAPIYVFIPELRSYLKQIRELNFMILKEKMGTRDQNTILWRRNKKTIVIPGQLASAPKKGRIDEF